MRIIFSIKDEGDLTGLSQSMKKVAESLIKNGADIIIAGCTEIPLVLKQEDLSVPVISSTKILAIRTCPGCSNAPRNQGKLGHQILKFNSNGEVLMTLGKPGVAGDGEYEFNMPSDVLVAPNGDIFVADV